jgi:hypothetical protein
VTQQTPAIDVETLDLKPYFDLELLMQISQSKRLEGDDIDLMAEYWARWMPHLRVQRLTAGKIQYLLVWLDEPVEKELDAMWESSPGDAFTLGIVAQALPMGAVRDTLPDVAAVGCAPVPKPTDNLLRALDKAGVPWEADNTLGRQFAMLTHYPFKGGCAICHLNDSCPNAKL